MIIPYYSVHLPILLTVTDDQTEEVENGSNMILKYHRREQLSQSKLHHLIPQSYRHSPKQYSNPAILETL